MNAKQGQRWGIILVLAGFAVGIPGFWLLIAHDHFEATARIRVIRSAPDVPPDVSNGNVIQQNSDFIQGELKVIQSENILAKVVETLHLDAEWGNKYAEGRKLELAETLGLLKQSLRIRQIRDSWLVDISIISEDAAESAKIANAVAEAYHDYRLENMKRSRDERAKAYKAEFEAQENAVKTAQEEVDRLKKELNVPDGVADEKLDSEFQPYSEANRALKTAIDRSNILKMKISADILDRSIPQLPPVVIVDSAIPPTIPIGPNRTLGKGLIGVGVLLLVCGFVTFVRNWRRPDEAVG